MSEFCERVVRQRTEGKWLGYRVLLIALYAVIGVALLSVAFANHLALLVLLPLIELPLIVLSWRYVCVEYEYSLFGGTMSFSRIYGKRRRRTVFECDVKRMVLIAPDTPENRERALRTRPQREYCAVSGKQAQNVWLAVIEEGEKQYALFFFEADDELCAKLRFYNPSAMTRR